MSDVNVELDATCDRTGKIEKVAMSITEAAQFHETRGARSAAAAALHKELKEIPDNKKPDLVVMYRGQICVLGNVNPKSDASLARLLHEVTTSPQFAKPTVKNRKSKETEVKEVAPPQVTETVAG